MEKRGVHQEIKILLIEKLDDIKKVYLKEKGIKNYLVHMIFMIGVIDGHGKKQKKNMKLIPGRTG